MVGGNPSLGRAEAAAGMVIYLTAKVETAASAVDARPPSVSHHAFLRRDNVVPAKARLLDSSSPRGDIWQVIEIRQTEAFAAWFRNLRDRRARARIQVRIDRLSLGNPGDAKPVGEGVSELRIDYGPGYRIYFVRRGDTVIVLLAGGDKRTQTRDIEAALRLARLL